MIFLWLQRVVLLLILVVGGFFALENQQAVTLYVTGLRITLPVYLFAFLMLSVGFVAGVVLQRLSLLAQQAARRIRRRKEQQAAENQ